jgi:hypothetical protein
VSVEAWKLHAPTLQPELRQASYAHEGTTSFVMVASCARAHCL